jgi:hypothetical protein
LDPILSQLSPFQFFVFCFWRRVVCVGCYHRLGGTYFQCWRFEDGGYTFLRNVGNLLQHYTTSKPRIPQSMASPRRETQISHSWIYSASHILFRYVQY